MEHELDAYLGVINRFIAYHGHRSLKKTDHTTAEAYPFVAMDTRQVFEQISFVHDYLEMEGRNEDRTFRFLDVGCGIGNILLIAEQYGFDVYGFERDEASCRIAMDIIGKERVWLDDAWKFENYGDYDVVYFFRPLPEAGPQSKLEQLIEERIKPGAVLIGNLRLGSSIEEDPRFSRLHEKFPIWRKGE
ncbi:MAG: methyltransferase domain-containing protein [Thermodesulfobacteriota bacterium]